MCINMTVLETVVVISWQLFACHVSYFLQTQGFNCIKWAVSAATYKFILSSNSVLAIYGCDFSESVYECDFSGCTSSRT